MNITTILKEGNKNLLKNDNDLLNIRTGIVIMLITTMLILLIFYCCSYKIKKEERIKYPTLLKSTKSSKSSTNSLCRTRSLPTVLEENDNVFLEENNQDNAIKKTEKSLYPNLEGHNIL
tara:strand:+ start:746 stop:1102 length:357 start_codon:yes stop_codon:yes gene_type:complete